MGWWSKTWKKVKNVFKKVTKVVKKVVKSVGKTAKKVWDKVKDVGVKVWDGVKSVTKKVSKTISKLGPFANIAMNFIPGFGQLWAAYGIWGQVAKGAITGFVASGGNVKGMLVGAAVGGLSYGYAKLPGTTISEKINGLSDKFTSDIVKKGAKTYSKLFQDSKGLLGDKGLALGQPGGPELNPLDDVALGKQYKLFQDEGLLGDKGLDLGQPGGPELLPDVYNAPSLLDKEGNWADKLKSAIPTTWGDTTSAQQEHPYSVGGGGSLTSYDTAAGVGIGRGGYGRDPNEELVRSLGLTSLLDQYNQYRQKTGYA